MQEKIIIAYDFMAKGGQHNLYQLGFLMEYPNSLLYLDKSSKIIDLSNYYEIPLDANVKFQRKIKNIYCFFRNIFSNVEIHIIGASLKLLCLFFIISLLVGRKHIKVHLHGQIYGYNTSRFKKNVWKILSYIYIFYVSNPAFQNNEIFYKLNNINLLKNKIINCNSTKKKSVFVWVNRGVDSKQARSILSEKGYFIFPNDILINQNWVNYLNYISNLAKSEYIHIGFYDEYYLFSPSGRLSEAVIHNKKIILINQIENIIIGIKICNSYNLDYLVV